jgi:hypothetical protein
MRGLVLGLCLAAGGAAANDGFGGLSATGLTFARTDAVVMETEDLTITPDRISVSYTFRNITAADVTGEVIFPLPPIPLSGLMMSAWNLPADLASENPFGFTVTVDGKAVPVAVDRIAVVEPPWQAGRTAAAKYDAPGRDVTAVLARHGLPLTLDAEDIRRRLLALPAAARADLAAGGVAEWYDPAPGEDFPPDAWANWSVVLRHHWTQRFPAGQVLRIDHSYAHHPPGGLFGWQHPPTEDWQRDLQARYCIDNGTSRAIARALPAGEDDATSWGMAWNIAYVLRTAGSWAGPVRRFRLTLDKGAADRVISLCAEGVVRTGPTTFVIEKTDFTPDRDLDILLVAPPP